MKRGFLLVALGCIIFLVQCSVAQPLSSKQKFTHQDTLRGSITPERAWWDVLQYSIQVTPDFLRKYIAGSNRISFKVVKPGKRMQIDLQQPMNLTKVQWQNKDLSFERMGNVYYINFPQPLKEGAVEELVLNFEGRPREAVKPPWDGGWIWQKDDLNRPWITVACQGLGASVWYPCKDHQSDEPDKGALVSVTVTDSLQAVANGRLKKKETKAGTATFTWEVVNPINNYTIVPYIGKYINFSEIYQGEKGALSCSYWVLDYNTDKAKKQFQQVPAMLKAFEYWFGPYPFYEDGFKLVETPHLGMEHQSAVAYGNKYVNGYLGTDLSNTGWGLKWDYIIVHESGHEWFANNITTNDIADMWVHEGFTDYSEALFIEYYYGKEAANAYVQGIRRKIENNTPIIGPYGVNQEGSGDMYYKGANLLHTIRQVINNDSLFRNILRGLNKTFYHQTVTSRQIENYISTESGKNLLPIFDQYLRTTQVPILEYRKEGDKISFRWANCIEGFEMPVRLANGEWIYPATQWKTGKADVGGAAFSVDKNFYIMTKQV